MKESIIEKQIEFLHSILSNIAEKDLNKNEKFELYVKKYFCFDNDFGWNILMNSIYVFQDTELAKENFNNIKFNETSSNNNIGSNYLRLYGVLNALYQQSIAINNLMELFKFEPRKNTREEIKNSSCIVLRNKIAAHPSNYADDLSENKFDVYEISRNKLNDGKIFLLKNQNSSESYDLENSILDFDKKIQEVLSIILEKFLNKKFNKQSKFFQKFIEIESYRKEQRNL